jgi:hypothetical protein
MGRYLVQKGAGRLMNRMENKDVASQASKASFGSKYKARDRAYERCKSVVVERLKSASEERDEEFS